MDTVTSSPCAVGPSSEPQDQVRQTSTSTSTDSGRTARRLQRKSAYRFALKLLLGLACVFFALAVSAAAPRVVRSLLEIRQQQVVIQKFDLSCGAAALATLLRFQYGENINEHDVAAGLMQRDDYLDDPGLVRQREGFSLLDLKRYVQRRGYDGVGYGGLTLHDLVRQAPIMVPVKQHGYRHFVVFRGQSGTRAVLADPAWGNRTMPIDAFIQAWADDPQIGGIGFVIQRRDHNTNEAPVENRLAPRADDAALLN